MTVLLLLLSMSLPMYAQEDEEKIDNPLVLEGIDLFREGKLDQSIATFLRAIQQSPNDAIAYNALGVVYSEAKDLDKAMESFDKAISLKKPYFKAIYNKLNLLLARNEEEAAIGLLRSVVKDYPDHADGWINLGVLVGRRGQIDEAHACFDKAIAINNKDFDALFKKGQLFVLQKRYQEASDSFQRAVDVAPDFAAARQALNLVNDIIEKKKQGYIRVRQILVASRETAEQLKADLAGGSDFVELARRYSIDATAKLGGDLGFIKKGSLLEELESVLFSLQVGQVSDIVRTPRGYHIFKREE